MGSAASTMSADPRASATSPNENDTSSATPAPSRSQMLSSEPSVPRTSTAPPPPPRPDVAALRAAALKSKAKNDVTPSPAPTLPPKPAKKSGKAAKAAPAKAGKLANKASKLSSEVTLSTSEKEDGEISDDNAPGPSAPRREAITRSKPPPSMPKAKTLQAQPSVDHIVTPGVAASDSGIVRSTVLTISNTFTGATATSSFPGSPSANGECTPPATTADLLGLAEQEWLKEIRGFLHDGLTPKDLVAQGAPTHLVAKVCEDIVAGTKQRRALWNQVREPGREASESPSVASFGNEAGPSRPSSIRSRSSSPDIAVAVAMGRTSSESSTEALIERMIPPQPYVQPSAPRIMSSWTPNAAVPGPASNLSRPTSATGAIHIESYRPLPRPQVPAPVLAPAPQHLPHKGRRRRDLDHAHQADALATLNYGDDDESSIPAPPSVAPPPIPPPPPVPAEPAHPAVPERLGPSPADLIETRRRALLSMRRGKTTPTTPVSAAPTPPPQAGPSTAVIAEAASLEREILGSTAEVPMDIDDEMEDGEIPDDRPEPTPPPRVTSATSSSTRRGVKRPHAEDMMDNTSRPTTTAYRPAPPKRRLFCVPPPASRLLILLDDDSDSDDEHEDEGLRTISIPVIVIPEPVDEARLLAERKEAELREKNANILRLKEQIAAKLAAKKASVATPTGASTPTIERRVADAEEAAQRVGVDGVAADVVHAAVLAVAQESKSKGGTHPDGVYVYLVRGADRSPDDVPMEVADAPGWSHSPRRALPGRYTLLTLADATASTSGKCSYTVLDSQTDAATTSTPSSSSVPRSSTVCFSPLHC